MKTLYIFTLIFLACSLNAQQNIEEILASNNTNSGKEQHSLLASQFSALEANNLNGVYNLLSEAGNILEVRTFDNGKLDGTWMQYDENQNLIAIANYKNNQKHGKWIIWDTNGNKRYELFYENGTRTGTWKSWDDQGVLISSKEY
jgi:antitoxin component YwqK of YwqJK toxin-antitoxin module